MSLRFASKFVSGPEYSDITSKSSSGLKGRRASRATSISASSDWKAFTDLTGQSFGPYKLGQELGKGTFGTVYACQEGKKEFAIKLIHVDKSAGINEQVLHEGAVAGMLSPHPNIMPIVDVCLDSGHPDVMGLVMPLGLSNLKTFIQRLHQQGKFDEQHAELLRRLSHDVVCGLNHMHSSGWRHMDLKPANVILFAIEAGLQAKLADFGLSLHSRMALSAPWPIGTPAFMAPEIHCTADANSFFESYRDPADIWALGVTILNLWFSVLPFMPSSRAKAAMIKEQADVVGVPPESSSFWERVDKPEKGGVSCLSLVKDAGPPVDLKSFTSLVLTNEQRNMWPSEDTEAILDIVWRCLRFDPRDRAMTPSLLRNKYFSDLKCPSLSRKERAPKTLTEEIEYFVQQQDDWKKVWGSSDSPQRALPYADWLRTWETNKRSSDSLKLSALAAEILRKYRSTAGEESEANRHLYFLISFSIAAKLLVRVHPKPYNSAVFSTNTLERKWIDQRLAVLLKKEDLPPEKATEMEEDIVRKLKFDFGNLAESGRKKRTRQRRRRV